MDNLFSNKSDTTEPKNLIQLFVFGLILVSFALNIWGFWNVSNADEYNEVVEALRVCSGHLNFDR